jgi:hypothetical protein
MAASGYPSPTTSRSIAIFASAPSRRVKRSSARWPMTRASAPDILAGAQSDGVRAAVLLRGDAEPARDTGADRLCARVPEAAGDPERGRGGALSSIHSMAPISSNSSSASFNRLSPSSRLIASLKRPYASMVWTSSGRDWMLFRISKLR